jgi:hypothetical protein
MPTARCRGRPSCRCRYQSICYCCNNLIAHDSDFSAAVRFHTPISKTQWNTDISMPLPLPMPLPMLFNTLLMATNVLMVQLLVAVVGTYI